MLFIYFIFYTTPQFDLFFFFYQVGYFIFINKIYRNNKYYYQKDTIKYFAIPHIYISKNHIKKIVIHELSSQLTIAIIENINVSILKKMYIEMAEA